MKSCCSDDHHMGSYMARSQDAARADPDYAGRCSLPRPLLCRPGEASPSDHHPRGHPCRSPPPSGGVLPSGHLPVGSRRLGHRATERSGSRRPVNGSPHRVFRAKHTLTLWILQSRLYAYERGQVSGTFLITSIAAAPGQRGVPPTSMVGCVGSATFQRRQAATAFRFFEGSEDAAPSI